MHFDYKGEDCYLVPDSDKDVERCATAISHAHVRAVNNGAAIVVGESLSRESTQYALSGIWSMAVSAAISSSKRMPAVLGDKWNQEDLNYANQLAGEHLQDFTGAPE